jgi:hypothetical protein
MPKKLDLVGQTFGRLTVESKIGSVSIGQGRWAIAWNCACECGSVVAVPSNRLRTGKTRSCGCLLRDFTRELARGHKRTTRQVNLSGNRYGRLTAIEPTDRRAGSSIVWKCACDCGTEVFAPSTGLRSGDNTSCGCGRAARATKHGGATPNNWSPEYVVWTGMLERCLNPNHHAFPRYGGRGITICDQWRDDFAAFRRDMGPRPRRATIDRIDNDLGYEPGNCRWATYKEQARNKSNNHRLTIGGDTLTIAEWSERSGISQRRILARIRRGWDPSRAILEALHAETS